MNAPPKWDEIGSVTLKNHAATRSAGNNSCPCVFTLAFAAIGAMMEFQLIRHFGGVAMPVLRSDEFAGDDLLEACAVNPMAHLNEKSSPGKHILKVQLALERLRPTGPKISAAEKAQMKYGPTTAAAVLDYKKTHAPPIINYAYQSTPDDVVGVMTIKAMDDDLKGTPLSNTEAAVDRAHALSRSSLQAALGHLYQLSHDIRSLPPNPDAGALEALQTKHARNIAVIRNKLILTDEITSQTFRQCLDKLIIMCQINLAQPKTTLAAGHIGMCDQSLPRNQPRLPFAWTDATLSDPKTHLCDPFFRSSLDLQRDVITHEYFHLQGTLDIEVHNTTEAFKNANTLAQIVAFLADRFRQRNSDGHNAIIPPLPAP